MMGARRTPEPETQEPLDLRALVEAIREARAEVEALADAFDASPLMRARGLTGGRARDAFAGSADHLAYFERLLATLEACGIYQRAHETETMQRWLAERFQALHRMRGHLDALRTLAQMACRH